MHFKEQKHNFFWKYLVVKSKLKATLKIMLRFLITFKNVKNNIEKITVQDSKQSLNTDIFSPQNPIERTDYK